MVFFLCSLKSTCPLLGPEHVLSMPVDVSLLSSWPRSVLPQGASVWQAQSVSAHKRLIYHLLRLRHLWFYLEKYISCMFWWGFLQIIFHDVLVSDVLTPNMLIKLCFTAFTGPIPPSTGFLFTWLPTLCVAGWHRRWESAAEEVDHFPEGSALVLSAWRWLPLQHNPRHVCAHAEPWGLEEHSVLWSFHVSVVRNKVYYFSKRNKIITDVFMLCCTT